MDLDGSESRAPSRTNPWLIIMLTAPLPLILLGFLIIKWSHQRSNMARIVSQFMKRQNTILAYDASSVAANISDLLEKAARDSETLSLVPPTPENFVHFHQAQRGELTKLDLHGNLGEVVGWTFYNHVSYVNLRGETVVDIVNGEVRRDRVPLARCRLRDLCDRALIEEALRLPVGKAHYGSLLRYYTPEGHPSDEKESTLRVAYRAPQGLFVVGIDYRQLRDNLTMPSFPYSPKRNLMEDYRRGNYLYVLDENNNVIIHPKAANVIGIDRTTGTWVPPMTNDGEEGTHPINLDAYRGDRLREYFNRLLRRSFTQSGVDLFQAPNLAGARRVLSVIPIWVARGQYKDGTTFGHAVVGCNVDYFEEPKEHLVPYY